MAKQSCCFSSKFCAGVIGTLSLTFGSFLLVPHILIINRHDEYLIEYVKHQSITSDNDDKSISFDDDFSELQSFTRSIWIVFFFYDVIFTISSLILIIGVLKEQDYMLLPWLIVVKCALVVIVVTIISIMFGLANYKIFILFCASVPPVVFIVYIWFIVFTLYKEYRAKSRNKFDRSLVLTNDSVGPRRPKTIVIDTQEAIFDAHANNTKDNFILINVIDNKHKEVGGVSIGSGGAGNINSIKHCSSRGVVKVLDDVLTATKDKDGGRYELDTENLFCQEINNSNNSGGELELALGVLSLRATKSSKIRSRSEISEEDKESENSTPPPPYDDVTIDKHKEAEAIALGVDSKKLTYPHSKGA